MWTARSGLHGKSGWFSSRPAGAERVFAVGVAINIALLTELGDSFGLLGLADFACFGQPVQRDANQDAPVPPRATARFGGCVRSRFLEQPHAVATCLPHRCCAGEQFAYLALKMNLDLQQMSREQKLQAMHLLWEDLAQDADSIESPSWHGDALRETEERVRTGTERSRDWEEAKQELRKPTG